jgi:hypothetical protein
MSEEKPAEMTVKSYTDVLNQIEDTKYERERTARIAAMEAAAALDTLRIEWEKDHAVRWEAQRAMNERLQASNDRIAAAAEAQTEALSRIAAAMETRNAMALPIVPFPVTPLPTSTDDAQCAHEYPTHLYNPNNLPLRCLKCGR